jgi:hypothetical protein
MPAKKRPTKKAPSRARRAPARTKASPLAQATNVTVAPSGQGFPVLLVAVVVVGILAVVGLAWWMIKRGEAPLQAPQPLAAMPSAPPAISPPATPMIAPAVPAKIPPAPQNAAAPQGRDVASTPAPAPMSSKPEGVSAHREQAGAQSGAAADQGDSLLLKLGSGKSLTLRCWGSADSPARLDVFGPHNRLVRSVVSASSTVGWKELSWDGSDAQGSPVRPGSYFLRPSQKGDQVILDARVKN